MELKSIKVEFKDKKVIATLLEERIYLGITDVFREDIVALFQNEFEELIINLGDVTVMNSSGLGVLILAQDMMKKRNGIIKLTNLQPLMQDIFSRMRLDTLFKIYDTVELALED